MKKRLSRWLDQHMQEVLRGTMVALPLRVLGAGLAFGLNILLARILGAEDTGLYYLALTTTTISTTIATLGLGNVLVRHAASGAAQKNWAEVQGVARVGTGMALICAVGLTILLASTADWLSEMVLRKPELATPLRWMALSIVPQTQLILHAQLLRGLKRIAISQLLQTIAIPVLMIVFLVGLGGVFGVTGAVWSYSLASFITGALAFWMWKRIIGRNGHGSAKTSPRELLRSGFPLLQSRLLVVNTATLLMLGAMSSSSAVAIYGVAYRTTSLLRLTLMAVNSISGPKFAALYSMGNEKALGTTARRSALLMTLAASPLLLVLLAFPDWIMGLFGKEFISGAGVLLVLALAQFIAVVSGSIGSLLTMSGNERLLRNNNVAAFALSILLNFILIPEFGALGAAMSACAAVIVRNLLGMYQVYRRLGILPFFVRDPSQQPDEV